MENMTSLDAAKAESRLKNWCKQRTRLWLLSWPPRIQPPAEGEHNEGSLECIVKDVSSSVVTLSVTFHPADVFIAVDRATFGTQTLPCGEGLWIMLPNDATSPTLKHLDCLIEVMPFGPPMPVASIG